MTIPPEGGRKSRYIVINFDGDKYVAREAGFFVSASNRPMLDDDSTDEATIRPIRRRSNRWSDDPTDEATIRPLLSDNPTDQATIRQRLGRSDWG